MIRALLVCSVLVATPFTSSAPHAAPVSQAPQAAAVTAAQAAPFLGDWALALQGEMGPANGSLTIKVEQDKVLGQFAIAEAPPQAITDITILAKTLTLRYLFDYQGQAIDAMISLTPQEDGKVAAQIAFAGGAYTVMGSATKKEAAK